MSFKNSDKVTQGKGCRHRFKNLNIAAWGNSGFLEEETFSKTILKESTGSRVDTETSARAKPSYFKVVLGTFEHLEYKRGGIDRGNGSIGEFLAT